MKLDINKKFTLTNKVEQEHIDFYNHFGFIHYKNFITAEHVAKIWQSIEAAHDKLIADKTELINGIPIKFGYDENGKEIIHRLPFSNIVANEVQKLYEDARFEMLKKFIPNHESRFGFKEKDGVVTNYYINTPKSNFKQMGWHTDVTRDVAMGKKVLPMINVGIYLDASTDENGGLRILPCSQHQNLISMLFKKVQFVNTNQDPNEILLQASAGDLALHDGRMWHRVGKSEHMGAKSRRRVMYIPLICGDVEERNHNSKTPFYHKLKIFAKHK
jgi:ectoine hydroxylase-related dioxygenase (phytanoyl-CoA dioxygenase family)